MSYSEEISQLAAQAIALLTRLIGVPSLSRGEDGTALLLMEYFESKGISAARVGNNIWARNRYFNEALPTLLLNSHHDTVAPNSGYVRDPFSAENTGEKLFGLGSNDAGGALVSLIHTFLYFYDKELPFNVIFGASAEEEISGKNGVELLLKNLPPVDMAIVGEPTLMQMAVAEKGLLVLDCTARGIAGHAARNEGVNAIYEAISDIGKIKAISFDRVSSLLGPVHLAVTSIETKNKLHNVVPDTCSFVVDLRVNERYTFEEILSFLRRTIQSDIEPRSLRLQPSFIDKSHPLVLAGESIGLKTYGSPTLSDMALMSFPAIKIGPGDSSRSHIADEFIFVNEIPDGIEKYISLIGNLSGITKK